MTGYVASILLTTCCVKTKLDDTEYLAITRQAAPSRGFEVQPGTGGPGRIALQDQETGQTHERDASASSTTLSWLAVYVIPLLHRVTPFRFVLWCKKESEQDAHDEGREPSDGDGERDRLVGVVLDVHVRSAVFQDQWNERHWVTGERHVTLLFRDACGRHQLFKKQELAAAAAAENECDAAVSDFAAPGHDGTKKRKRDNCTSSPHRRRGRRATRATQDTEREAVPSSSSSRVSSSSSSSSSQRQDEMLAWMSGLETRVRTGDLQIRYDTLLTIPGTTVVLCTEQFVFIERHAVCEPSGGVLPIHVNGGLILGDRNAGKSLVVQQLVYGRRGVPGGTLEVTAADREALVRGGGGGGGTTTTTTAAAPGLRDSAYPVDAPPASRYLARCCQVRARVTATLLVVPGTLVDQWIKYFEHDPKLVCVYNKRTLRLCTRERVQAASVVIVSHSCFMDFLTREDEVRGKIRARVLKYGGSDVNPNVDCGEETRGDGSGFNLNWFYWARIVVDEVLLFFAEYVTRKPCHPEVVSPAAATCSAGAPRDVFFSRAAVKDFPAFHTELWWGLQGGVSLSSPADSAKVVSLIEVLCGSRGRNSALCLCRGVVKVDSFSSCIYAAPALDDTTPVVWLDRTVFGELSSHEQQVYDTLVHLDASPSSLRGVCVGDLSFMNKYMTTVAHWAEVVPLGVEAINRSLILTEEEIRNAEVSDDGDGGDAGVGDGDSDYVPDDGSTTTTTTTTSTDEAAGVDGNGEDAEETASSWVTVPDDDEVGAENTAAGTRTRVVRPAASAVVRLASPTSGEPPRATPSPPSPPSPPPPPPQRPATATTRPAVTESDHVELTTFFEALTTEIGERREYFVKTSTQLSKNELTPTVCAICLVNVCDVIFVCGHMLCHVCVIDLFHSNMEDDEDDQPPELLAPCPTCRWLLEPAEVFWVLDQSFPVPSKFVSLEKIVAARPGSTTVVMTECPRVLRGLHAQFKVKQASGVEPKLCPSRTQPCVTALTSWPWKKPVASPLVGGAGAVGSDAREVIEGGPVVRARAGGRHRAAAGVPVCPPTSPSPSPSPPPPCSPTRVLFLPLFKTFGLKLHNVDTVVFVHPVSGNADEREIVERQALACIIDRKPGSSGTYGGGTAGSPLTVIRLVATDTIEHG
jgi:hypothetical protein